MPSFRSNATKAEVRAKLPKQDEKKDNDDWARFEVIQSSIIQTHQATCAESRAQTDSMYLWKTQITLDLKTSWSNLRTEDKEKALLILDKQCGGMSPGWGDYKRPVIEWRLYNLHRSAIKAENRRQASAGNI